MMDGKITAGLLVLLAIVTLVWLVNRCMVVGKEERVMKMNVEVEKEKLEVEKQKVGVEKQKVEGDIEIEKQKVKGNIEVAKDKIGAGKEKEKGKTDVAKEENGCQEAKGWWGEGWRKYEEKKVNRIRFVL